MERFSLHGAGEARRKQKKQPERGAAPLSCGFPCHFRAEQSSAAAGSQGRLPQHQAAGRQREILAFSRLAAHRGLAKTADRPLEALPARRMVSPADRLDGPAEQPAFTSMLSRPKDARSRASSSSISRTSTAAPCQPPLARCPQFAAASVVRLDLRHPAAPGRARSADRRWTGRRSSAIPSASSVAVNRARGTASNGRSRRACALLDEGRHAGKPIGAAAARGAHGHRLGLVVGMVRHQQMQDAALAGRPRTAARSAPRAPPAASPCAGLAPVQRRIAASMPRRASSSRVASRFACRSQRAGRDRRSGPQSRRRAPWPIRAPEPPAPANRGRPTRRRREPDDFRTARKAPSARANSDAESGVSRIRSLALLVDPPLLEVGGAWIVLAEARNTAQASGLRPSAASVMPSFSRLSGPLGLVL